MEFGIATARNAFGSVKYRLAALVAVGGILCGSVAHAGNNNFNQRAVGGVIVNAEGVVRSATVAETAEFANLMRAAVRGPRGEVAEKTEMRVVSLRGLGDAIRQSRKSGGRLPESIRFLAGLQRVEFVFVDAEASDILIAGPAEPWKLHDDGSVVGSVTGGATLLLDDLVVAMRTVEPARENGISCSIEPTEQGRNRLQQLMRRVRLRAGENPLHLEASMRRAFGPQQVLLTGMNPSTHYARTLVAADFEMKRIAMKLAESGIRGLPSYLEMSKDAPQSASSNPRWWLACNYDALQRSADGTAWKLSGQGVKTQTAEDTFDGQGKVTATGKANRLATRWAELMTEHFNALAKQKPIFGGLRNVMDLTVVATLIRQEGLDTKAGLDLAVFTSEDETLEPEEHFVPTAVEPYCSFIRGRKGWTVTASGGVEITAFDVVENQRVQTQVAAVGQAAIAARSTTWWWNK